MCSFPPYLFAAAMVLLSAPTPLPALRPDNTLSFYPWLATPFAPTDPSAGPSRPSRRPLRGEAPPSGPSVSQETGVDLPEDTIDHAALLRALTGRRPAGTSLTKESDALEDQEVEYEDMKHGIDKFGNRFLQPYGLRLTLMEMEQRPSPEPSDADQERRQEDRNGASPLASPMVGGMTTQPVENGEGEGEVDLDASVEDLDASGIEEAGEDEDMDDE